jgi:dipeptidase E
MMDGKLTTLLIRSLPEMGVQAGELKDTLERAGLKDYRTRRNRSWLVAPIAFCIIGAIFILGLARRRPQISACVSCVDETPAGERAVPAWNHCDFAARLYCAAAPKAPGENFVVSPCGVASGLALMGSGSCGDTLREIRRALSMKDEWEGDAEGAQQDFCDVMVFQRAVLRASSDDASRVETADAIVVGGGNTWNLVRHLHQNGLIEPVRRCVKAGTPYVGWSAGANVACPTMQTTNDMPVVDPLGFDTFGLVPFQINPHYTDRQIEGHGGETREERILEYLAANPKSTVVGLREGCMLNVEGGHVRYVGKNNLRLFINGRQPIEIEPDEDFDFLLKF